MKIYKITNIEKLLPNYEDHGVLLSTTHPNVQHEDEKYQPNTQPNLWYHMIPEQVPGTYSKYFKEKLNIPEILSKRTIKFGNETANYGSAESISFEHVFHIDKLPWGIIKDPLDSRKIILMTPRSYIPENSTHVHSGRGYMWKEFTPAQLGMDTKTIDMIMELFSVEIHHAIQIILEFNDYLKMS